MKKIVKSKFAFAVIAFFLCFMACHVSNIEAANTQITKVNGKTYSLKAIQYSGIWYVPIDAIASAQDVKGATSKTTYRVTLSNGTKVTVYFNQTTAKVGTKKVALSTNNGKNAKKKPLIQNRKVYVPLAFAKKYLNVNIVQGSSSLHITKKNNASNSTGGTTEKPEVTIPDNSSNSAVETQILNLVNQEREKVGLPILTLNTKATKAANIRAKELASSLSHTRPDGSNFSTALDRVGITMYRGCGENIAAGHSSAETVMKAWMNSSGHRSNILHANYKELGIGYYEDSAGEKYWVQLFLFK